MVMLEKFADRNVHILVPTLFKNIIHGIACSAILVPDSHVTWQLEGYSHPLRTIWMFEGVMPFSLAGCYLFLLCIFGLRTKKSRSLESSIDGRNCRDLLDPTNSC